MSEHPAAPVRVAYADALHVKRAGAYRRLAAFVDGAKPDILALATIDPGQALALATRFAMQWAYRGGQALLWNGRYEALQIEQTYLPASFALPIDRRGFLCVEGMLDGSACTLAVTRFHTARSKRIVELRFVRTQLRDRVRALVFASIRAGRIGLSDLGFAHAVGEGCEAIWTRGFSEGSVLPSAFTV